MARARNCGLDLLRFVAIFLVLGRHLRVFSSDNLLFSTWHRGGWIGVDVFFVLSGFLVSGILFKEYIRTGGVKIGRFLIRRGIRIYGPFYLFIAITLIYCFSKGIELPAKSIVGELLFLQNYVSRVWNHTWSIAVEEHFYLMLSLLFFLLFKLRKPERNPFRSLPLVFFAFAIGCLLLRISFLLTRDEFNVNVILLTTHYRMDSLFYGVFLAYLWHFTAIKERLAKIPGWSFIMLGILFLLPAFFYEQTKMICVFGVNSFYIGAGFLLLVFVRVETTRNFLERFIAALGSKSYSIYLWHMPVNAWIWPVFSKATGLSDNWIYLTFYVTLSMGLGYLMSWVIERPCDWLRDKIYPPPYGANSLAEPSKG